MSVIIILLIASITVASIFLVAFLWSVKKGQFDDEKSPPVRMLFDDQPPLAQPDGTAPLNPITPNP